MVTSRIQASGLEQSSLGHGLGPSGLVNIPGNHISPLGFVWKNDAIGNLTIDCNAGGIMPQELIDVITLESHPCISQLISGALQ